MNMAQEVLSLLNEDLKAEIQHVRDGIAKEEAEKEKLRDKLHALLAKKGANPNAEDAIRDQAKAHDKRIQTMKAHLKELQAKAKRQSFGKFGKETELTK